VLSDKQNPKNVKTRTKAEKNEKQALNHVNA